MRTFWTDNGSRYEYNTPFGSVLVCGSDSANTMELVLDALRKHDMAPPLPRFKVGDVLRVKVHGECNVHTFNFRVYGVDWSPSEKTWMYRTDTVKEHGYFTSYRESEVELYL